jgi:hypothetical protein
MQAIYTLSLSSSPAANNYDLYMNENLWDEGREEEKSLVFD